MCTSARAALLIASFSVALSSESAALQQRRWSVAARPELSIGEADGDDVYLFKSIAAARFLPDGRVVVGDQDLVEVRIFRADGKFEKKFGRKGQGPEDFAGISGLWITSKGNIAVFDPRNRKINLYNLQGVFQNTITLRPPADAASLDFFVGSFANDDVALAALTAGPRGPGIPLLVPDRVVMVRFNLDGEYKGPLGNADGLWRNNRYVIPFSAVPFTALSRDSVYVADGYQNEIKVRDARGAVSRTITAPPVKQASGSAVWAALEAQLRERKKALQLGYLERDLVPKDNRFPQIGGLVADDQGNIWVKAYDPLKDALYLRTGSALNPTPGGEWRVIRPDGRLVASVRLPDQVRPLEIKGNRLLGVSTDEFDVQRVVVHTIQR